MGAILKNIEFKGCTMGSLAEFKAAIALIALHKIQPVIHTVLTGLETADEGFELLKSGGQFGKVSHLFPFLLLSWVLTRSDAA